MDFDKLKQDGNVLLAEHYLLQWRIVKRTMPAALGRCDYDRKEIQINPEYLAHNPDEEVWGVSVRLADLAKLRLAIAI